MTSIDPTATPPLRFRQEDWFPHGGVTVNMDKLEETYLDALANPDLYPLFSERNVTRMKSEFSKNNPGKTLYPWQELLGIAFMLGLDASCIIGTGGGKTISMVLPLYAAKPGDRRVVLVICPLKQLQAEMYFRFKSEMGLSPIVINGDTWKRAAIQQKLKDRQFNIILVGPEMCLDEKTFRPILSDPDFNKDISHATLDEAHLVVLWGRKFRTAFDKLSVVRSILPRSVSWLVQSATLDPEMHQKVCKSLCISLTNAFHINLGNDRRNISQIVIRMKRSEDILARVVTLLKGLKLGPTGKLVRAIVFCETRDDTQKASQYMHRHILDANATARERIQYIHAGRTKHGRATVIKRFIEGQVDILCATECVGLGQNLPGLEVVVLARLPRDLCTAIQRIGRVGRDGRLARAFILADASAFERYARKKLSKPAAKSRSKRPSAPAPPPPTIQPTPDVDELAPQDTEPAPDDGGFRKKLDPALRGYLEISDTGCRCAYLDTRFNNPAPATNAGPRPALCCDLCIKRSIPGAIDMSRDELLMRILNALDAHAPLSTHVDSLVTTRADVTNPSLRKPKEEKVIIAEPRDKLQALRLSNKLKKLRLRVYCDPNLRYADCNCSMEGLLRSEVIDVIAADRALTTPERLREHPAFLTDRDALEFLINHEDALIEDINSFTRSVTAEGEAKMKAKKHADAKAAAEKRQRKDDAAEARKRQALEFVNVNANARQTQANPLWRHGPENPELHQRHGSSSGSVLIPMLSQALSTDFTQPPFAYAQPATTQTPHPFNASMSALHPTQDAASFASTTTLPLWPQSQNVRPNTIYSQSVPHNTSQSISTHYIHPQHIQQGPTLHVASSHNHVHPLNYPLQAQRTVYSELLPAALPNPSTRTTDHQGHIRSDTTSVLNARSPTALDQQYNYYNPHATRLPRTAFIIVSAQLLIFPSDYSHTPMFDSRQEPVYHGNAYEQYRTSHEVLLQTSEGENWWPSRVIAGVPANTHSHALVEPHLTTAQAPQLSIHSHLHVTEVPQNFAGYTATTRHQLLAPQGQYMGGSLPRGEWR